MLKVKKIVLKPNRIFRNIFATLDFEKYIA